VGLEGIHNDKAKDTSISIACSRHKSALNYLNFRYIPCLDGVDPSSQCYPWMRRYCERHGTGSGYIDIRMPDLQLTVSPSRRTLKCGWKQSADGIE
jgi:hypothetical protein